MPPKCEICGHSWKTGLLDEFGPACRCAEVELWSCEEHCEQLTHGDHNEAIEEFLDRGTHAEGKLVVYGWKRQELPAGAVDTDYILETVLESIDEEYGNPDQSTKPNEAMIAAARKFEEAICANYEVWTCEQIQEFTINVTDWVNEHRPDWGV